MKRKHKKKVSGKPANPDATVVRLNPPLLPYLPMLLLGPTTPEEDARNLAYAKKRAKDLGVS